LLRTPAPSSARGEKPLADVVRDYVNHELASLGVVAELSFERGGQEYLALTTPPWDFTVSSAGGDKLGLREFRVAIRRDGRLHQTVHLVGQVRVSRQVVVAQRPLSIGNTVRRDDLGFETRVFDHEGPLGVARVEEVIGQEVKRFIPAGEMVLTDALRARALVQRSQPVTVTGAGTSVQVRLTGEALDSGSYGDTVRVRVGDGRRQQQVLRGVVTGVSTVRLAEGEL
jgi:flagella basal body P-ring formation protein FlgA